MSKAPRQVDRRQNTNRFARFTDDELAILEVGIKMSNSQVDAKILDVELQLARRAREDGTSTLIQRTTIPVR